MPQDQIVNDLTQMFLALSDGTRLRLLALMLGGEVSVGYLARHLGESQPKTSRHLAYLRGTGLVSTRREGKCIYYGIQSPADVRLNGVLEFTLRSLSTDGEIARRTRPVGLVEPTPPSKPSLEAQQDSYSSELEIFLL